MKNQPVGETSRGLAIQPGKEILSIQLRPDGLSFAYPEAGEIKPDSIRLPKENPEAGFDFIFSAPEWPSKDFQEVRICIPTDYAVLIPAELDAPEKRKELMSSLGYPEDPGAHLFALCCPENRVLLHGVCDLVVGPLTEKYGDKLSFYHPLYVNLYQPEEESAVLRIDKAGGYGNFTLHNGKELLFADVFPLASDAELLLAVSRIIATNKVEAPRIVCSGDGCENNSALLGRHYRNVSVHPQGESRNLFSPWVCG